jgi:hypothetical protein
VFATIVGGSTTICTSKSRSQKAVHTVYRVHCAPRLRHFSDRSIGFLIGDGIFWSGPS